MATKPSKDLFKVSEGRESGVPVLYGGANQGKTKGTKRGSKVKPNRGPYSPGGWLVGRGVVGGRGGIVGGLML